MSTTLRLGWLALLRRVGVRQFVVKSSLGHPFVCHLGDFFGENPFYNRHAWVPELELCAAWLRTERAPVVLDVGGNIGFWSTQLAQMLADVSPTIYAFEPVPQTFCKLVETIDRLGLGERVRPLGLAVSNSASFVSISMTQKISGFAQVSDGLNTRVGTSLAYAMTIPIDNFVEQTGCTPSLLKVDIEGSEIRALKGAQRVLRGPDRPAVLFEFNPITLGETGGGAADYHELLQGYALYYVDDFDGQLRPFGSPAVLEEITWVANIFAVPDNEAARARFTAAMQSARSRAYGDKH